MRTAAAIVSGPRVELGKVLAFLRRDVIVAWSYRTDFFSDIAGLVVQVLMFYFIGLMVDSGRLPTYGGESVTYLEFAAIGVAMGMFVAVALGKVARVIREEQLMGTLESLLLTPTRVPTLQVGSAAYDLLYVPVRTAAFLGLIAVAFHLDVDLAGLAPAAVVLLMFVPFVWGLGLASAAAILAFRRGAGAVGLGATLLTVSSGAYFPLDLLPGWLASAAVHNPFAVALDGMRDALLGGAGWSAVGSAAIILAPLAVLSLALGLAVFRRALRRELRRGTLGLY